MKKLWVTLASTVLVLSLMMSTVALGVVADMNHYQPYDLTATLMPVDGTHPYGSVDLVFKIDDLPRGDSMSPWAIGIEKKIGNGPWIGVSFDSSDYYLDQRMLGTDTYHFEQLWNEDTAWTSDVIVSYRVNVSLCDSTFSAVSVSPWSNITNIGIKSSSWATVEIQKALDYDLVPDSIKDDYTKNITRQEFAQLAVKLYEVYMGTSATPASPNPFFDCSNSDVLKAYQLKIVNGVSATAFKPLDLTNREQIAAMLYRAVQAVAPDADMSLEGAPIFGDSAMVAPYFADNVKFMSKHEFIKGSNGSFNPKGTCTREMAVLITVRVYEKYK